VASGEALEQIEATIAAAYSAGSIPDDAGDERPVVPDGVDPEQGRALTSLVAAEGANRTVEVGFALGLSCLHICAGLLCAGGASPRHVALDPTEGVHWRNAGLRLVERAGASAMVDLLEEESSVGLPRLFAEGERFDLAFIDGDHRYDPAFVDLYYATRIVVPGGLILVDDMWMPAVRLAVAYFEANLELELLTDACEGAFTWSRRRPRRGVRGGSGRMAVLRMPDPVPDRPWDHFAEFV
jgi:predicted O-methyltransferase YrrM